MTEVKAFAPASISNLCVGFDSLGMAINSLGDEVIVRKGSKKGLVIKSIKNNDTLSKSVSENTAGISAAALLEELNCDESLEMEIIKKMPVGTGLGSSAASAVAGVMAVNAFLGSPKEKIDLLAYATRAEQIIDGAFHADNTAPCLLGGIVLVRDNNSLDCISLPVNNKLKVVLLLPNISLLTKDSRNILRKEIDMEKHIRQTANMGAFVAGLYESDFQILKNALNDVIVEEQRAHLVPEFYKFKEAALEMGALGCSISGAGPSIFALCHETEIAASILRSWNNIANKSSLRIKSWSSEINLKGAFIH
jgi:homoserine kinase